MRKIVWCTWIKYAITSQWDGSPAEGAHCQPWWFKFNYRPYMVEGETHIVYVNLLTFASMPMCECTHTNTHKIDKYTNKQMQENYVIITSKPIFTDLYHLVLIYGNQKLNMTGILLS